MALKHIPTLAGAMTPFPYSIDAGENIRAASEMMQENDIRHLPVTRNHELVGVISDRDVLLAHTFAHGDPPTVDSMCTHDPYVVDLHTRLDDVLDGLAENKVDAAIVTREGKLAGILTSMDACQAFAETIRKLFPPPSSGDVA